jgi:3D (Asp-Asp-Asp) domain-containing protein
MRKYFYIIGISLISILVGVIILNPTNKMKTINNTSVTRSLKTSVVNTVSIKEIERKKKEAEEAKRKAEEKKKAEEAARIQARKVEEASKKVETKNVDSAVLASGSGRVSYYGLDCAGCSGRVGAGKKLNGVYYNDPKFGYVRALAAGKEYSYGTIIRISGTPLGTFTGIVLDRGGNIGSGRRFMFDVLVGSESEAYRYGVSSITYQVLRYGY